jgi:serine/threonine-protein kinase
MAPEVLAGTPANVASDVYGIAASLYFALTGSPPREANNAPVSALIAGIPSSLDDAIVRALDAEPTRRHASAEELAAALARTGLHWDGSWTINRDYSRPPSASDPTIDPEAPPTQVEPNRRSRPSMGPANKPAPKP